VATAVLACPLDLVALPESVVYGGMHIGQDSYHAGK
jgi:hypothetical protein